MSQLVVGPVTMDFGWNIMQFNPFIRWRLSHFPADTVIVICREEEKYIWEDIATDFYFIEKLSYSTHRWLYRSKDLVIPYKLRRKLGVKVREHGNKVLIPNKQTCTSKKKKFCEFGEQDYNLQYDIVFHARGTTKYGSAFKNWPPSFYGEFVDIMGKDLRMCSVGVEAHHVPGTDDMREIPIGELCNLIRSSRIVVGPACGFMALANLCRTPALVWTEDQIQPKYGKRDMIRFLYDWRPFKKTPIRVVEKFGWQPKPQKILKEFLKFQHSVKI